MNTFAQVSAGLSENTHRKGASGSSDSECKALDIEKKVDLFALLIFPSAAASPQLGFTLSSLSLQPGSAVSGERSPRWDGAGTRWGDTGATSPRGPSRQQGRSVCC